MRTLLRVGLALPAALMCLAAAPRPAAAHGEPFIAVAATRDGGIHVRLGNSRIIHERRVHAAQAQRMRRLVHRQQLRLAAARVLRAGQCRTARRLLAPASRIQAGQPRYRGWR